MLIDLALIGYGALVGLSLGLTGGGGSILAIPLLVYGAGFPMQEALAVSLLMVATIAIFGALKQTTTGQINWRAAILFSLAGMIISPVVVAITHDVDETLRSLLFAVLMLVVAWRMITPSPRPAQSDAVEPKQPPSFIQIAAGGGVAGALAGFFGVGGGFVIVPLLTLIFSMPYAQAVGTSLASIALISSAALIGHVVKGVLPDTTMLLTFIGGGLLGLLLGISIMNKIPERIAKRTFALITAGLAIFILVDKLFLHKGGVL